jgi:putative phosphoribosyl transferase
VTVKPNFRDLPDLRDRVRVFRDRPHAGEVLAGLLAGRAGSAAVVLGIPAGGVPVAARLAQELGLELDAAVVSKITPPWNTEVGYGAVAFDGTVRINEVLVPQLRLSRRDVEEGIEETRRKVERRMRSFREDRPFPNVSARPAILVDDGLASGFTMAVAVEALHKLGAKDLVVAVPTGHLSAVEWLAPQVEDLACANVRGRGSFAVADAYESWSDVTEEEARQLLQARAAPAGR